MPAAAQTPQASVVTRGASIVRHSSAADGRVRVSLHLEKQGLTDTEAHLLLAWYKVSIGTYSITGQYEVKKEVKRRADGYRRTAACSMVERQRRSSLWLSTS
eukprot:134350-Pelagomonas_calceolata.AAC.1